MQLLLILHYCRIMTYDHDLSELQIRRGERDNLGIICCITPLKRML